MIRSDGPGETSTRAEHFRRQFLVAAGCATGFGVLHHIDHIARANHVGWPVIERVTPFTFSLLVYALLVPGLLLTARRRVWAGYWLATAIPLLLLVSGVHFNPQPEGESVRDIYGPYADPAAYCSGAPPVDPPQENASPLCQPRPSPSRPLIGPLAFANMFTLVASLVALLVTATRARRASAHW